MRLCSVEGCEGRHDARGLCRKHYKQWRRYGVPATSEPPPKPPRPLCVVEGCGIEFFARSLCKTHYARFMKYGSTDERPPYLGPPPRFCSVEGCESKHEALGFCNKHYVRFRTHGSTDLPTNSPARPKAERPPKPPCAVEGCGRESEIKGWCGKHHARYRYNGDPTKLLVTKHEKGQLCSVEDCEYLARKQGVCGSHYTIEWQKRNPERTQEMRRDGWHRRDLRRRNAEGRHTRDEWLELVEMYVGLCAYCPDEATTEDHVVPLVNGGTDHLSNIVPACKSCNSSKHAASLLFWMLKRKKAVDARKALTNAA